MLEAEIRLAAQFYDLDPMGVVWHGNYARFFELARCALLDKINYGYEEMEQSGYSWPIVDMRTKFIRPIFRFQEILVIATLSEFENRLRIDYRIRDAGSGEVLTKGQTTQVAVALGADELCLESPPALIEKVREVL